MSARALKIAPIVAAIVLTAVFLGWIWARSIPSGGTWSGPNELVYTWVDRAIGGDHRAVIYPERIDGVQTTGLVTRKRRRALFLDEREIEFPKDRHIAVVGPDLTVTYVSLPKEAFLYEKSDGGVWVFGIPILGNPRGKPIGLDMEFLYQLPVWNEVIAPKLEGEADSIPKRNTG